MDYIGISAMIATVIAIVAAVVLLRDGGVRDGKIGAFFHFDSFSIEGLVKFAYIFGSVLLVAIAVFDVIEGVQIYLYYGTTYIYYLFYYLGEGVLVLVAGEVVLRIVAELVMILVNVAEDIHALREELEEDDEDYDEESEDEVEDDSDDAPEAPEGIEAADEEFYDEDAEEAAEDAAEESEEAAEDTAEESEEAAEDTAEESEDAAE